MAKNRRSSGRSKKESPDGPELLAMELQQIHSAEEQLSRALPRLAKAAESEGLRKMLDRRLTQGERLLKDVDAALEKLDGRPARRKNVAAEGLINDARRHVQEVEAGPALDSTLVAAVQKTEHYCIAAWGTARSLAESLGHTSAGRAMERALKEGKELDERLTQLAERELTPQLISGEDEESDDEDELPRRGGRQRSGGSERRTSV